MKIINEVFVLLNNFRLHSTANLIIQNIKYFFACFFNSLFKKAMSEYEQWSKNK